MYRVSEFFINDLVQVIVLEKVALAGNRGILRRSNRASATTKKGWMGVLNAVFPLHQVEIA